MGDMNANPATMRSAIAAIERQAKIHEESGNHKGARDEWDRAARLRNLLADTIKPKRTIRWR